MWNSVKFEEGSLRAVAYKEGKIIKDTVIHTAGEVNELRLSPDRTIINSSGQDLSYILIEAFDKSGNFCPLANDELKIKVTGAAVLEGAGNGNPQSFEPFTNDIVNLFYGKAMVIVRGLKGVKGEVNLEIENAGGIRKNVILQVE
jgi:beta-galactosidase